MSSSHGSSALLQDIQRMLTDAVFADMVFVCSTEKGEEKEEEEEEEIGACRMLVASRSPVLQSILLTSEPKLARVPLPGIDPGTMHICLEFLYTDSVQITSWSSILVAMKVVKAANFFRLHRLESLAITYMTDFLTSNEFSLDWINEEFITAYSLGVQVLCMHQPIIDTISEMGALLDLCRTYIICHMETNSERRSERLIYKSLSELALDHLKRESHLFENDFLSEYLSFLHVVKWNAYRLVLTDPSIDENELAKVLDRCFPRTLQGLLTATNIGLDDANIFRFMKLIANPLAECLQRVPLTMAKMPTDIVCKIIEPLDLIPPSILLTVYKLQAFSRLDLRWDPLGHGKSYNIEGNDLTIISCNQEGFQGFARCSPYARAASILRFDWEIVMLVPCEKVRIGFCFSFPTYDFNDQVLGDEKGSWALGGDGLLHHTSLDGRKHSVPYVDPFCGVKEAIVQVHLDVVNGHCSFVVNGKAQRIAWMDLPTRCTVYPAISLQRPGRARVHTLYQSWMGPPSKRMRSANVQ